MATAKKAASKTTKASAKPAAKKASPHELDAIALLMADHKEVKAMFKAYEDLVDAEADDDEKLALASQICAALTVHATIEEEIFYPASRDAFGDDDDGEDMIDEAEVEHGSAKELIAQIQAMQPSEPLYDAKVHVLGEYIDHHVKEEEGEMFPKCKKSDMDLKELGVELSERKQALMSDLETEKS